METSDGAVVVGVDGSDVAHEALRWAAREAVARRAPLHLIYAFNPPAAFYGGGLPAPQRFYDDLELAGKRLLEQALAAAREVSGDLVVTAEMPSGPPVPVLVEASRKARLIVLGASGRGGFAGMLVGSTAVGVSAHAHCATVIVRGETARAGGPVVVGVDGSPVSERAIAAAFEAAARCDAPLVAVHAFSDGDFGGVYGTVPFLVDGSEIEQQEQRLLAECLAGRREKYPDVLLEQVTVKDGPRPLLLDWARRARLVVVGSRGRGGFAGLLLGSTSQALIHHAGCPVMIVREDGGK
ncbi:MAG TPA: universal stress protein [Amycolatopsis sp.]|uniref:universal stress protein n=1 Tax=Amycolatopsis sp. TaxID=37632 RepID=UPI002B466B64|nr:universal stress protein [Amycolatopsis sp.]HKS49136.1 universal stress protein [Amycolatopsis sp.]